MKTYVLLLSRIFPKSSIMAGKETFFREGVLNAITDNDPFNSMFDFQHCKVHTIRLNYELWKKRMDEIQAGKAKLSVRQWSGAPYRSKQETIIELTAKDGIGVQKLSSMDEIEGCVVNSATDVKFVPLEILAINDGLEVGTFKDWFKLAKPTTDNPMVIIHLTKLRY